MKPRLAGILELIVFYGLLGVIALSAIPYGTVEPWWVALFECLVFVLALLTIVEAFLSGTLRVEGLSLLLPLLLLALFILFQSLSFLSARDAAGVTSRDIAISADPYNSRLFAIKLFALVTAGALLRRYTYTSRRLRALVYVVIGIGIASALFALFRKNTQSGPTFLLPNLTIDDRNFGQFINKNHFAYLMEMSLGPTLALLLTGLRNRGRVVLLLPMAGLLWTALVISNSRGGVLGSLCEVLFLCVMLDPVGYLAQKYAGDNDLQKRKRLPAAAGGMVLRGLLILAMLVLFVYGVAWIGGEPVVNNFQSAAADFGTSGAPNNANTSRRQMWAISWKVFKDHPLAGIGFGAYWIGVTKYHDASGELTPQQAHNDYLDLLAAGGLIGLALVTWFAVIFVVRARERLHSLDPFCRVACLGALTGIFGVAVHSFLDFGLHVTVNAAVFVVLIVVATARMRQLEGSPSCSHPVSTG
ncbi:MAG: hypothetical protein JWM21_4092 [Acidobacteria bacterium]|nr:hypothetical protein [Acidobacteriota bacterium]